MPDISIDFNNSNIRTAQNITITFQNYVSADWSGGYVEIAPPFGSKVKKTLTSEAVYVFTREDKSLLDGSNRVVEDCDLNPTEVIRKGDFKRGKWVINYKDARGTLSSQSFLIKEPPIKIDYKINVLNSTCEIYDKTNYKLYNSIPKTNKYSLKVTAPAVACSDTGTMGKTYTSPETWNSGSLLYINNRANKSVVTPESDKFIITPIYNATYYIRYESEFTYISIPTDITSSMDSRAAATTAYGGIGSSSVTYKTGPVIMGMPISISSPSALVCDIWERIKDIDIKYKQSLCKNTVLAGKLRDILDRTSQLFMLYQQAMQLGNIALAGLYLDKIIDITKTRLV